MSEEHVCVEGVDALTLTEDRTPSTPASEAKEIEDSDDFVDPWNVASKNDSGVDYDKLISEFSRRMCQLHRYLTCCSPSPRTLRQLQTRR